ncbi:MAG: cobalamin biosynthesis protein, partial [Candidatus Thermoplasmatota archaeon]
MLLATHSLLVDQILILAIAVILDLSFGEPPEKVHPVAWIGKSISFFDKRVKRGSQRKEKLLGIVIALFTIVLFSSPCVFLYLLRPYSRLVYIFVSACVFKTTFAIRALEKHARATITNDLERKRYEVSKIVSRDT